MPTLLSVNFPIMVPAASTDSPVPTKPHLKALTGLRFFPAIHVVLYHLVTQQTNGLPTWLRDIIGNGYVGVSLFFVLSGFILAYSYLDKNDEKVSNMRVFWIARFSRIYPVYLLGIVVMIPFYLSYLLQQSPVWKALLKAVAGTLIALSLLQSWLPQTAPLLNHPSWSLSVEAFFYSIFPFAALAIRNYSKARLLSVLSITWVLSLLAPLLYWLLIGPGTPTTSDFWIGVVKFNPLLRLPEFLIGVLLGKLFLLQSRNGHTWAGKLSLAALVLALLVLANSSDLPYVLMSNCLLVPVFAVLIYNLAFNQGTLSALLSLRPVVLLGEASYALYIIHIPVYTILALLADRLKFNNTSGVFLLVYLLCVVPTSILVLHFLERPMREALKSRLVRRFSS